MRLNKQTVVSLLLSIALAAWMLFIVLDVMTYLPRVAAMVAFCEEHQILLLRQSLRTASEPPAWQLKGDGYAQD